ncbi:WHEP-TRS domain-containing protein [Phthorimaea operculella]|nr:WHEP-TRS domain-containing protein [Phthorimaea operculella]
MIGREDREDALLKSALQADERVWVVSEHLTECLMLLEEAPNPEDKELVEGDVSQCLELAQDIAQAAADISRRRDGKEKPFRGKVGQGLQVPLPPVTVPVFAGDYADWPAFEDLYSSVVHTRTDITPAYKMAQLMSRLHGEPHELLTHLAVSDSNYEVAWKILTDRYRNKRLIVDRLLDQWLSIPTITRGTDLREKIFHPVSVAVSALERQGLPVAGYGYILVHTVLRRLPSKMVARFEQLHGGKSSDHLPTYEDLKSFLEAESRRVDVQAGEAPRKETSALATRNGRVHRREEATVGNPGGTTPHWNQGVPTAGRQATGWQRVRSLLRSGFRGDGVWHSRGVGVFGAWGRIRCECPSSTNCRYCQGAHHPLLCMNRSGGAGAALDRISEGACPPREGATLPTLQGGAHLRIGHRDRQGDVNRRSPLTQGRGDDPHHGSRCRIGEERHRNVAKDTHPRKKVLQETGLVAVDTTGGYVVFGPVWRPQDLPEGDPVLYGSVLSEVLQRFWESEEPPTADRRKPEDDECELFYQYNTARCPSGRFVTRLPFLPNRPALGWIKRFVNNCRKPQAERNFTPVLSPAERNAALCSLVRVVQAEHFEEEEWKPGAAPAPTQAAAPSGDAVKLNEEITKQGDLVRSLKSAKAEKAKVDEAVKTLLDLKAKYKAATGQDWKPGTPAPASAPAPSAGGDAGRLNEEITKQGDLVRSLKSAKAEKAKVDEAVKVLLDLKAKYKAATGQDWKPGAAPATPAQPAKQPANDEAGKLSAQITAQGDKVRKLKSEKADKNTVDVEVKNLLNLKAQYKSLTGTDWTPNAAPAPAKKTEQPAAATSMNGSDAAAALAAEVAKQGEVVRDLKAKKADKATIDAEVKKLLDLKAKYQAETGTAYQAPSQPRESKPKEKKEAKPKEVKKEKPKQEAPSQPRESKPKEKKEAKPKEDKKEKPKQEREQAQGEEYQAPSQPRESKPKEKKEAKPKEDKKEKPKQEREQAQGEEYQAPSQPRESKPKEKKEAKPKEDKKEKPIQEAPSQPRESKPKEKKEAKPKEAKKEKPKQEAPSQPRESKPKEKKEAKPKEAKKEKPKQEAPSQPRESKPKEKKEAKPKEAKEKPKQEARPSPAKEDGTGPKKITRLGMEAKKDEDLPEWYSQVITKSEMIDYYDISGCYILRPWSYSIWDRIREFLSPQFKQLGVKDGYFPIFVSKGALEREKKHIEDFAPEVAWVTHSGSSELAEHIAIRPTSETAMYPAFARWIQSHRDLPYKLNQWNNVVRWEFKQPQPFLRTREFLWQEGHTAFRTPDEAGVEVLAILDLYRRVYEDLLAVPVIPGRKSEKEKFAGSDYTCTVEGYVPASGRGIQGATSHHLGQNFSKMFEVVYDDPETHEKAYVYQNSWGITTRTIGVMVLVHGDDKGLVLPPRVADIQVIVVPCGITASSTAEERKTLIDSAKQLVEEFVKVGIRAEGDYRDNYSPGWKFNHWEVKVSRGQAHLKRRRKIPKRRYCRKYFRM